MNTIMLEIMLALGITGHLVNRWCDYVLAVYPNGKIMLNTPLTEENLSRIMQGADPDLAFKSAMYGAGSMLLEFLGYAAIAYYVWQYQPLCGIILLLCAAVLNILGGGHHVRYALTAWYYIKLGCSHEGWELFDEAFHRLPITKACYAGYLAYIITLIVTILMGSLPVPLWALLFTVLPIFILMLPFRIIGTLHYSAIVSFVGWMILIAMFHA